MRTNEILALGVFGSRGSRLGDRIAAVLRRGREFSPLTSGARVAMSAVGLLALLAAASLAPRWIAFAQAPTFDVVSVKAMDGNFGTPMEVGPSRFKAVLPIPYLIERAYGIREFQITGGPAWIKSQRFDIEGHVNQPAEKREIWLMVRTLLEERFHLRTHRESRELAVYVLTPSKTGLRIAPAKDKSPCDCIQMKPGELWSRGATGAVLSQGLTTILDRPVINEIGSDANYNFKLIFDQSSVKPAFVGVPNEPTEGASIFTAVQEQLGLRLDARKVPVEMLVIDQVERPDAN